MKLWQPDVFGRLFDPRHALDQKTTVVLLLAIASAMLASGLAIWMGAKQHRFSGSTQADLTSRWWSWCWLILAIVVPILLGPAITILAVCLLSLLCYREYARTVGVFRHPIISAIVVICIFVLAFSALDHFDRLYFACGALGTGLIVVCSVLPDQPKGFIQRVALGVFGFLLFGYSLGYLALMTNSPIYRPLLLSLILAVEANDVFAYCCGKLVGGRKLLPNTSPGKTLAGAVGAVLLTTVLVAILFHFLFIGTAVDRLVPLIFLGVLISILGQLGDLTLSSIKRDVGIKDFGKLIPGHGGLLDRFDSLVLVPPAVYHFLSLVLGPLGGEEAMRIITGGLCSL